MTSSFILKELPVPFIVKALNFAERNSSEDLFKGGLADVCKIDVLKDFAKVTGKHLHQILYLMKLRASSLHLCCKRDLGADVFQ